MEIIDELEPQRRNARCGSIGLAPGFAATWFNIVHLPPSFAINGQIYCSAGGGIIADSEKKRNIRNFDKVNKILRQLEEMGVEYRSLAALFLSRFQLLRPQISKTLNHRQAAVLIPIVVDRNRGCC